MTKEEQLQKENEELKYDVIDFQERYKEESEYSDTLSKELKNQRTILDILKCCSRVRHNELQIYISNRTDGDIGNDVRECDAFDLVKKYLEND